MKRSALASSFQSSSGNSNAATNFLDFKSHGTAVIHVHGNTDVGPDMEVEERLVYRVPCELPETFERRYDGGYKRTFLAKESDPNPFEDLRQAVEGMNIDDATVVLHADGVDYTKADLLGRGNDWRKSCKPSREYLFAVVASSLGGDKVGNPTLQILAARPTLAESIDRVIDAQVREHGEEEGEAAIAGYGIEIRFDRDAEPARMYSAQYNGRRKQGKIKDLLDGPGVDLARYCGPPDAAAMLEAIEAGLVIEVPGFAREGEVEEKPKAPPARKSKLEKAKERKPAAKKPEPVADTQAESDSDAGDLVDVVCPNCDAEVQVSPTHKDCAKCGYRIIPW